MILAKLKTWALALFAVLAAIATALLYGRHKGKQAAEQAEVARDAEHELPGAHLLAERLRRVPPVVDAAAFRA